MMTHRERIRAVLRGELPDRIPIVCRLNIWHQTREYLNDFPEEIQGKSIEQLQLDLGMGVSARIAHAPLDRTPEIENADEGSSGYLMGSLWWRHMATGVPGQLLQKLDEVP